MAFSTGGRTMASLSVTLLGPPEVTLDGKPVASFASNKVRALLAYLAVEADRPHRRDALVTLLWPNRPDRAARTSLRRALYNLRRAIGDLEADPPFLHTSRETIQFNSASESWVDVVAFRALLATEQLEEAVALYRGPFLEGFSLKDSPTFDDWCILTQEQLHQQALMALQQLTEQYEHQGQLERACEMARRQVELEPWREEAHRDLMRLLALRGLRSTALRQYQACEQVLREELGVAPDPDTAALYRAIRERQIVPLQTASAVTAALRHSLPPQPTPFIGREEELAQITRRLADPACHLLTVMGPGGIGKSRLAIQAAEDHLSAFRDGVWYVPLTPVGSADLLASAIMEALDVPRPRYGQQDPQTQLLNYLRERQLLLILDNFEHLLEGTPLMTEIVGAAAGVKLLVTSRERLNLRGEWLLSLGGMRFPGGDEERARKGRDAAPAEAPAATLEDFDAVQLFVQCVRQLQPQFSLAAAGPSWVARICQLVEGMPLAIELAAPWARAMRCQDIAQAIERDMGFLATTLRDMPVRHRSMRAVFDRSWEQLSDRERRVLERLSVFRGGFLWQAAEDVAGANLTMLSSLVDRSWLRPTPSGRYDFHELVRQYASEHLEADQQVAQRVRDRHTQYFAGFLRERQGNLKGWGQANALQEVLAEMGNVQVAWRWAVERGLVEAIEGCLVALWLVGETRGWYHEVQQAFEGAATKLRDELHAGTGVGAGPAQAQAVLLLAEILPMQAYFCKRIGASERAKLLCDESLALLPSTEPGLRQDIACAEAKSTLGLVLLQWGEPSDAAQLFWEALALTRVAGDAWIEARTLLLLGWRAFQLGEYAEAETFLRQAIAASDREGEQWHKSWNLHTLALVLIVRGEYGGGEEAALESLQLHHEMRDRVGPIHSIMALGDIDMALGRHEQAAQRYQEGFASACEIGSKDLQSWSLSRQGWLTLALGRYAEARKQFERAHALAREIRSRWRAIDDLIGLGHATCALGDLDRSRKYLCQALGEAMEAELRPEALSALVGLAGVSSREGDLDRAIELLALVLHHPASSQMTTRRAQRALCDLASELPQEALAAATARGQARDLEELAAEILDGGST